MGRDKYEDTHHFRGFNKEKVIYYIKANPKMPVVGKSVKSVKSVV